MEEVRLSFPVILFELHAEVREPVYECESHYFAYFGKRRDGHRQQHDALDFLRPMVLLITHTCLPCFLRESQLVGLVFRTGQYTEQVLLMEEM